MKKHLQLLFGVGILAYALATSVMLWQMNEKLAHLESKVMRIERDSSIALSLPLPHPTREIRDLPTFPDYRR